MFTSRLVQVGGVRLHLESGPATGPGLLCLHGVLRAGRDFAPLLGDLCPRWMVHLLDQRGHGRSERSGRYRVGDYAADATAVVGDHLEGPIVILGHSLGALVAIAVAAALPDRIRGIILEDPPSPVLLADVRNSGWHAVWSGMHEVARLGYRQTGEVYRALAEVCVPVDEGTARLGDLRDGASLRFSARCLQDLDPEIFVPLLAGQWLEEFDLERLLDHVRCPALLLRGDPVYGGMMGREEAQEMVKRLKEGILVDVQGTGHLIHWTAAETMRRLVLGFLGSLN